MKEVNFNDPYTLNNKLKRLIWLLCWGLLANPFPRKTARKWKLFLLRFFGAKIHSTCTVYSFSKIYMPWNLEMKEYATIAGNVIIENAAKVTIESYATVSQYSYLCTASHDIRENDFPQFSKPIIIGKRSWVSAKCFIGPGVTIGEGSVLGATSSVFKDVEAWTIVGGNPAKIIGKRKISKNHQNEI
jgi:putative colanic acid biosynthesis acetyltransferase WcaF